MERKTGKEMAQEVALYLNGTSNRKEFIEQMAREHPTLQQFFTGLCLEWIKHNSETKFYDLRNDASVQVSKEIWDKVLDPRGGTFLPLV